MWSLALLNHKGLSLTQLVTQELFTDIPIANEIHGSAHWQQLSKVLLRPSTPPAT